MRHRPPAAPQPAIVSLTAIEQFRRNVCATVPEGVAPKRRWINQLENMLHREQTSETTEEFLALQREITATIHSNKKSTADRAQALLGKRVQEKNCPQITGKALKMTANGKIVIQLDSGGWRTTTPHCWEVFDVEETSDD